jgi:hypothetical protein
MSAGKPTDSKKHERAHQCLANAAKGGAQAHRDRLEPEAETLSALIGSGIPYLPASQRWAIPEGLLAVTLTYEPQGTLHPHHCVISTRIGPPTDGCPRP